MEFQERHLHLPQNSGHTERLEPALALRPWGRPREKTGNNAMCCPHLAHLFFPYFLQTHRSVIPGRLECLDMIYLIFQIFFKFRTILKLLNAMLDFIAVIFLYPSSNHRNSLSLILELHPTMTSFRIKLLSNV